MKQKIYAATVYGGYMTLIKASSLEEANKEARCDAGASNVQNVALASAEDIAWVRAMGGRVPELDPVLPSEWAKKGYYVIKDSRPKPGANIDYYDRDGIKRQGKVRAYDADLSGDTIHIDGERTVIVPETFKIKYGR